MLRAKFGNRKTEYRDVLYDSAKEAAYARQLDLLLHEKNGTLQLWERQIPFDLLVNGKKVTRIIVDFVEMHQGGHKRYVEIKSAGTKTSTWKLKWKLFSALYPELEKVVVDE